MTSFKKGGIYILSLLWRCKTTLVKKFQKIETFQYQFPIQLDCQDQMKKMEKITFSHQKITLKTYKKGEF